MPMTTPRRAWWFRSGSFYSPEGYLWTHLVPEGTSPAWMMKPGDYQEGDCICEQLWSEREGLT